MGQADGPSGRPARAIALVGPFQSGKTTLLDALLTRGGARTRQGRVGDGTTLGDASPEARAHGMSVELNAASLDYLDDTFHVLDCPGSVELQGEAAHAVLDVVDAAVVVCEPDEKKIPALQVILKDLADRGLPHFLFLNKIDKANGDAFATRSIAAAGKPAPAGAADRSRSGRTGSSPDSSIWRSNARTSTASMRHPRSSICRPRLPSARRRRGSRCWRSSPTMTMN